MTMTRRNSTTTILLPVFLCLVFSSFSCCDAAAFVASTTAIHHSKGRHNTATDATDRRGTLLKAQHQHENDDDDTNNKPRADPAFSYYNRIHDSNDQDENDDIVTQEMLWRDLLKDPVVKRKKGSYKPLDNRDALPFQVQLVTPDPYRRKPAVVKRNTTSKSKHVDLTMGTLPKKKKSSNNNNIRSSVHDGTQSLGEFHLDKSTNCGDVLVVGDAEYRVITARCQYKYAGGSRYVMVRKILEVKEVKRAVVEEQLQKQLKRTTRYYDHDEGPLELE